ncbi:hypothetical protein TNCV_1080641 [Trichonephila clavipes]|nr:hypothetical protein TNCV_1080641 [Trichonephila clavipes]
MSASARARASQKYKSRLSLEKRELWATHRYPNVRRRASEKVSRTSQKPTPRGTFRCRQPASTSTTGIPVLMDVTNEQTIDISIGSATELRDLNIS